MFTYVKAKNFKSLKDVFFQFNKNKTTTNHLIALYGENGSGKTHVVELFKFLQFVTMSRLLDTSVQKLPKEFFEMRYQVEENFSHELSSLLSTNFHLVDYRMIDETDPTEIEFGFKIQQKEGFYFIRFNHEILEEKLYYVAEKQKTYLFDIHRENGKIVKNFSKQVFKNEKYNKELKETIDQLWGKYSFLSLLTFEIHEKNPDYIKESLSISLCEVLTLISQLTVFVDRKSMPNLLDSLFAPKADFRIQSGTIMKENLMELQKYETVLNIFFTQAYADIKEVKYQTIEKEDQIQYELYFYKVIGGTLKAIPYRLESAGTKRILDHFDVITGALLGEVVVMDEIDNGIHDLLMKNIILSIQDEITGQLIFTTHNTLLLEVLPKENIYIIFTNPTGDKMIHCIRDYSIRIQKNHNARDLYLKGIFGGIPNTDYIDFEEIKYNLEKSDQHDEETS